MKRKLLIGAGLYLGAGAVVTAFLAMRGRGLNPATVVTWPFSLFNEVRPIATVGQHFDVRATVDPSMVPAGGLVGVDHGGASGADGKASAAGAKAEVINFAKR